VGGSAQSRTGRSSISVSRNVGGGVGRVSAHLRVSWSIASAFGGTHARKAVGRR
jgi:hypothetical protein